MESDATMTTFHWLLILGFSPADAAAAVRPDVFISDNMPATPATRRDERLPETA